MIPKYIDNWFNVIESMKNENTYKLAWGRALVECVYRGQYSDAGNNKSIVYLYDIAKCMLKYYWNQTFFFALKQAPTTARQPIIVNVTNHLINKFVNMNRSLVPVWFDKADQLLSKTNELEKAIKKIANVLPNDVSWRFKRIGDDVADLYEYDNIGRAKEVVFNNDDIALLKEYALVISKLLNYKWAQLLEKFNFAPKIANKVNSISQSKLRRESLQKYKNELMKQFSDGVAIDFYSGQPLEPNDISVDHVIPWSFMYSDDIWNLVLTSKSHNSSKSNTIPTQDDIDRLKERNESLVGLLEHKYDIELQESINNDYVDKYYYECRM